MRQLLLLHLYLCVTRLKVPTTAPASKGRETDWVGRPGRQVQRLCAGSTHTHMCKHGRSPCPSTHLPVSSTSSMIFTSCSHLGKRTQNCPPNLSIVLFLIIYTTSHLPPGR